MSQHLLGGPEKNAILIGLRLIVASVLLDVVAYVIQQRLVACFAESKEKLSWKCFFGVALIVVTCLSGFMTEDRTLW